MSLTSNQLLRALDLVKAKGVLPSALSSAEQREVFVRSMRERALIMARVTQADFLVVVKRSVEEFTAGHGRGKGALIAEMQSWLQRFGYDPATGFPGDEALGIPPAEPGSLRDLSSWKRLELVLETERALALGRAQKAQGETEVALHLFPAWEFTRLEESEVPRGTEGTSSDSWSTRWVKLGGPYPVWDRQLSRFRLIALKGDPIWTALGDSTRYSDCLNVDYPPFAFNSGFGWRGVARGELRRLNLNFTEDQEAAAARAKSVSTSPQTSMSPAEAKTSPASKLTPTPVVMPPPVVNTATMDDATAAKLRALLDRSNARLAERGKQ